jgi:light-regulated signal transduction histidine kinase (bacteriophytochrome)
MVVVIKKKEKKKSAVWKRRLRIIETEKALHRANKMLQLATNKLRRKDMELSSLNKELLTYTYISNHDLQEPLRNLQVLSSLILDKEAEKISEEGKEQLKRMQKSARHLQSLVQDLIEYSNTNKIHFKLERTNLNQLLETVKHESREMIRQSNTRIMSSDLCTLRIVPFQFHKLFKDLISNSIKFAHPKRSPQITITSKMERNGKKPGFGSLGPKYCHITFSDNGIGFEPRYRHRIFKIFQKLHGKKYTGTGIGLAICRKIVENHGGLIRAHGKPGEGTTIDIYIPVAANR